MKLCLCAEEECAVLKFLLKVRVSDFQLTVSCPIFHCFQVGYSSIGDLNKYTIVDLKIYNSCICKANRIE